MNHPWNVAPVDVDEPVVVGLLREYIDEIASRYYGRPATDVEIDTAIAEDSNDGLHPPKGVFLLARTGAEPSGCVGFRELRPGVAEIKRMYVKPEVRGLGLGGRLLATAEQHARDLDFQSIRLDTRHDLVEARTLYAKHGFHEIPAYNNNPYAQHWFEKKLP